MNNQRRFTEKEKAQLVAMRADGAKLVDIAKALDASLSSISYQLNAKTARESKRTRLRRQRWSEKAQRAVDPRHLGSIKIHTPREIRKLLAPPEIKLSAARAFAAGEITRSELMTRISP